MSSEPIGAFTFVLHGHLPYVLAHGRWPHGLDMLCECAAESYVPLLDVLHRLSEEGRAPKVTMGLTPVLCEQLADPGFKRELQDYLDGRVESARQNVEEFQAQGDPHLASLAERWISHFSGVKERFV